MGPSYNTPSMWLYMEGSLVPAALLAQYCRKLANAQYDGDVSKFEELLKRKSPYNFIAWYFALMIPAFFTYWVLAQIKNLSY